MTIPSLTLPSDGERARVVVLRGLPASGKSTAAINAINSNPAGTVIRINNDDICLGLFGNSYPTNAPHVAELLANIRIQLLTAALETPAVRLIIIDNTNLSLRTVHGLHEVAAKHRADFIVDDTFLNVPVEECITRDISRGENGGRTVGADVITRMASQARKLQTYKAPAKIENTEIVIESVENPAELPHTILVDIDGTLALNKGTRGWFDWARVGEDEPNLPVVNHVRSLIEAGEHVTIMSGRDSVCRTETLAWLKEHLGTELPLFMRPEKDNRPDFLVKHELYRNHIEGNFHVRYVLDDRQQVVDLWRNLGFSCWQVAEGNF